MSLRIDTFVFDMGNVLTFFSHDRMCNQVAALYGVSSSELKSALFESGLQWRFERGDIDAEGMKQELDHHFGRTVSLPDLENAASDIFELNTSIVPLLDELKKAGKRLVLLSNTCPSHVEFIRREFDVLDRFDHCILSYEVGSAKPEDEIYQAVINELNCLPQQALYTDDIAEYVSRAKEFGLNALVFTTTEKFREDMMTLGVH